MSAVQRALDPLSFGRSTWQIKGLGDPAQAVAGPALPEDGFALQIKRAAVDLPAFKEAESLTRVERWHGSLTWPQIIHKDRHFIGASAQRDISKPCFIS